MPEQNSPCFQPAAPLERPRGAVEARAHELADNIGAPAPRADEGVVQALEGIAALSARAWDNAAERDFALDLISRMARGALARTPR